MLHYPGGTPRLSITRVFRLVLITALAAWLAGCGGRCPSASAPKGGSPPAWGAQWCERAPSSNEVPEPLWFGTTPVGPIRVPRPLENRQIEGPITTWHDNDQLESHGSYLVRGNASVPHGAWIIWHPNGQRWSVGRYHDGQPVGCFAVWDEEGERRTAQVVGDQMIARDCEPPHIDVADHLELDHHEADRQPRGDMLFAMLLSPSKLGIKAEGYDPEDPELSYGFRAAFRKRSGADRYGVAFGLRKPEADLDDYFGYTSSFTFAHRLTSPTASYAVEVGAEAGIQLTKARPRSAQGRLAFEPHYFWTPLAAGQIELSQRLGHRFELTAATRLEARFPRGVEHESLFAGERVTNTFELGGTMLGLTLGFRAGLW